MPFRAALTLFLSVACAAGHAGAADVAVKRVFTGWRDAASFKRISEYFTGRENTGGQIVLRTDPAERAGYYFLIRTEQPAPTDAHVRVTVFVPGQPEPRIVSFPVRLPGRSSAINLGLTGSDWPGREASPVAWKVDVLSADGSSVIASERSYLWHQPASR